MKLSKERKAYAIILGLGMLALGADRFILGRATDPLAAAAEESAALASANSVVTQSTAAAVPDASKTVAAKNSQSTVSVARLVRALSDKNRSLATETDDAFAAPALWVQLVKEQDAQAVKPPAASDVLVKDYRITTVMTKREFTTPGSDRIVVLNGRIALTVGGGEVDGVRLLEIDETGNRAVFEKGGVQFELKLSEPTVRRGQS